jgi:hypothetical protein
MTSADERPKTYALDRTATDTGTEDQLLITIYFSHINAAIFNRKFLKNAEGIEITGTNQHNNWSNAR